MRTQVDSLRLIEDLRRRVVDLAATDVFLNEPALQQAAREVWNDPETGLVGELWVEGVLPPDNDSGTLKDTVVQGLFAQDLLEHLIRRQAWPADRQMFSHQKQVLEAADVDPGASVLVTSGTGTGKTEAFLLPLLNSLWTRPRRGPGVRALVLYPMNALVRDQMDRLDRWLDDQNRLTYMHYTSDTPETEKDATKRGVGTKWPRQRIRSREQARREPPDICVTNYSMLEYMLVRPQDATLFDRGLEVIVLDEAHLYTGTLASDIMFLLRRTLIRCGVSPEEVLHLATSATLGGEDKDLWQFLAQLTTTVRTRTQVIRHTPQSKPFPSGGLDPDPFVLVEADTQLGEGKDATSFVDLLGNEGSNLKYWPASERLRTALLTRPGIPCKMGALAKAVWPDAGNVAIPATSSLLRQTALAELSKDVPLIAHRLHLPLRAVAGLAICLNPDCRGPTTHRVPGLGALQEDRGDRCRWRCGGSLLPVWRCKQCGLPILVAVQSDGRLVPDDQYRFSTERDTLASSEFHLLYAMPDPQGSLCIDRDGRILQKGGVRMRLFDSEGATLEDAACPHREFTQVTQSTGLLLSVIAETALVAMPEDGDKSRAAIRPARGRRLLVFSDSRREAARLGPALTYSHEIQMIRSEFSRLLESATAENSAETKAVLEEELEQIRQNLLTEHRPAGQRRLEARLRETENELRSLATGERIRDWEERLKDSEILSEILSWEEARTHERAGWNEETWRTNRQENRERVRWLTAYEFVSPAGRPVGNSLEALGLATIDYPGLAAGPPPRLGQLPPSRHTDLSACWTDMVAALLDSLRVDGGITADNGDLDWEYSQDRAPIGKWVYFDCKNSRYRESFYGKRPDHRRNRFLNAILRSCGADDQEANQCEPLLATALFDWLLDIAETVPWLRRDGQKICLLFPELSLRRPDFVYMDSSGLVVGHVCQGKHPLGRSGKFKTCTQSDLDCDPRLQRMRSELQSEDALHTALWAEEHSAQLAHDDARRVQDLFEDGLRNVLSSSTTMELGVDIGGLNGVLTTNIPPNRSRYLQRAGRAGRRGQGSSVTLSFARNRPFDQAVFHDFGWYLRQELRSPTVMLNRDMLALRHAYAHVLGEFFRQVRPSERTGAMGAFGRMGTFTGRLGPRYWGINEPKPHWPQARQNPDAASADRFIRFITELAAGDRHSLQNDLRRILQGAEAHRQLDNWPGFCKAMRERFEGVLRDWHRDYDAFRHMWFETSAEASDPETTRRIANFAYYQIKELCDRNVIEELANHRFLPRFGFPIGVLQLRVDDDRGSRSRRQNVQPWRLQRAGLIGLREYAPGCTVLAGGWRIMSRGLVKHWDGNDERSLGAQRRLATCINGHDYLTAAGQEAPCPYCAAAPNPGVGFQVLTVHNGFRTAAWDPPRRARGAEAFEFHETDPPFIDQTMSGEAKEERLQATQDLTATYYESARILALNKGKAGYGFHICYRCGYAESEAKPKSTALPDLPNQSRKHAPLWMRQRTKACDPNSNPPFARKQVLMHEEITEALTLDFGGWSSLLLRESETLNTWVAGLPHAIAETLDIDPGAVAAVPYPFFKGSGILLYDTAPGGAGHVREMLSDYLMTTVLKTLRNRLFIDEDHHRTCRRGCLSCVLDYGMAHASAPIDRRLGLQRLDEMMGGLPVPEEEPVPASAQPADLNPDERKARAQQRRQRRRAS